MLNCCFNHKLFIAGLCKDYILLEYSRQLPLSGLQIQYFPGTNEPHLPVNQILAPGLPPPWIIRFMDLWKDQQIKIYFVISVSGVTLDFLAQPVRWHPRHSQCLFLKASAVPGSPLTITFTLSVVLKSALVVVSWPVVRPWFSTKMGGVS